MLCIVIFGCSFDPSDQIIYRDELPEGETNVITVLASTKEDFMEDYGNYFISEYPFYEIEVIELMDFYKAGGYVEIDNYLEDLNNQVDVIEMRDIQFKHLMEQNELVPLDTWITRDRFDIENIVPPVLEILREQGGGKVYGLAPYYLNSALYINRDLFEKHGVPLPKESLTWDDVISISERFPNGGVSGGVKGLYLQHNRLLDLAKSIGEQEGLAAQNQDGKYVLNTPEWKELFEKLVGLTQSQSSNLMDKNMQEDLFLNGMAAMTVNDPLYIDTLDKVNFDWIVDTTPTSSKYPGSTNTYLIDKVSSVHVNALNSEGGWELIKFIHSKKMADILTKSSAGKMMSRKDINQSFRGYDLAPFRELQYVDTGVHISWPVGLDAYTDAVMQQTVSGTVTLEEALTQIEQKAEEILFQIRKEQERLK